MTDTAAEVDETGVDEHQPGVVKIALMVLAVLALVVGLVLSFPGLHNLLSTPKTQPLTWKGGAFPTLSDHTLPTYQARTTDTRPDPAKLAAAFGLTGMNKVANSVIDGNVDRAASGVSNEVSYKNAHDGQMQIYDTFGVTTSYVVRASRASTDPRISKTQALAEARSIYRIVGVDLRDYTLSTKVSNGLLYVRAQQHLGGAPKRLSAGEVGGYVYFDRQGPRGMKFGLTTTAVSGTIRAVDAKSAWDAAVRSGAADKVYAGTYVEASLVWTTVMPRDFNGKNLPTTRYLLEPAWEFHTDTGALLLLDADAKHVGTLL